MKLKRALFFLILFHNYAVFCQFGQNSWCNSLAGANISCGKNMLNSLNPAVYPDNLNFGAVISFIPSLFEIDEVNEYSASLGYMAGDYYLSFSLDKFGFNLYNETILSLAASTKLSSFSVGFSLSHKFTRISSYGTSSELSVSPGAIFSPYNYLSFGIVIVNAENLIIEDKQNLSQPEVIAGIEINPAENLRAYISFRKTTGMKTAECFGIEYSPVDFFNVRLGFDKQSKTFCLGAGISLSETGLNFASSFHPELGITNSFDLFFTREKE